VLEEKRSPLHGQLVELAGALLVKNWNVRQFVVHKITVKEMALKLRTAKSQEE
jgi:hypothetical protein